MRILAVEDDELVADAITRGLTLAGFTVDRVGSAEAARAAVAAEHFDLAIIDIGLPQADGLELLTALRAEGRSMPALILTARYALQDKLRAFSAGADDFLMKPFEQAELAARCQALIRRAHFAPAGALRLGQVAIDLIGHQLQVQGVVVELTRREWAILEALAHNHGRVVAKERLVQALSGWDHDVSPNAIETQVSRLRTKLGATVRIRAIRGLGYRLEAAKATNT